MENSTMKKRTAKQEMRQEEQYRVNGRYAKMNPCEFCGVSCGATYYSSYDCNETGIGVCLCGACAEKSWKEYEAKYPEKFKQYTYCVECGGKLDKRNGDVNVCLICKSKHLPSGAF